MKERWGVSGSHGFLGASLSRSLEQLGHEVVPISRSGFVPPKLDYICLFGAYGNMSNQKDYLETYFANVTGVIEKIKSCERYDYKGVIVCSTSSVELPNQTFYSSSKKALEEFCNIYIREYNKPIVIVRPYSITGIGEQPVHLIPKLIDSCLKGTEIPFVGEPKHDFLDQKDFVNAVIYIANHIDSYRGRTVSLGSNKSYSNEQIRIMVENTTSKKANLNRVKSMRSYDTDNWQSPEDWSSRPLEVTIQDMVTYANDMQSMSKSS